MKVLRLWEGDAMREPSVVSLGFFDGLHIGHARLIDAAREVAMQNRWCAVVHTFDTMPSRVLKPQLQLMELTPPEEKEQLLAAMGVDVLAVSRFADSMHMRAVDFFSEILLSTLQARHIVAGFHHRFGYRGEGDTALLAKLCEKAGIGLDVIAPVTLPDGELVSSTAIREAIASGNMRKAESMLGRPLGKRKCD